MRFLAFQDGKSDASDGNFGAWKGCHGRLPSPEIAVSRPLLPLLNICIVP
jgi:hypothetical protein